MLENFELKEYNRAILDSYFFEKNSQRIVMPGFFNGDVLFVGQNPGLLKNEVEGDVKYKEAYINKDLDNLDKYYLEALKSAKGTLGIFINEIYGEDWSKLSFTNVIKTPFNNNDVCIENEEFHLLVLKRQIELLKPRHVFAIGTLAKKYLNKLSINIDLEMMHPSFLKKTGQYDTKIKEYRRALSELFWKENITLCETINNDVLINYTFASSRRKKLIRDYKFSFYKEDAKGEFISFDKKKVSKVFYKDIKNFKTFKAQNNLYESDVKKNIKFMIAEDCKYIKNQKIIYFDIETNLSLDTVLVDKEITSIACIVCNRCFAFTFRKDLERKTIIADIGKVEIFSNENEMITAFMKFISKEEPDILCGWNSDNFDIPYLLNRSIKLGIDINLISPINHTFFSIKEDRESARFKISGINAVDLMKVYKKLTYDKRPESYGLGAVSRNLFNDDKLKINVKSAWENNIKLLAKYNINDCVLLKKIDDAAHLTDFLKTMQNISFCPIEMCMYNKNVVDCYILKNNKNKIFPDVKSDNVKEEYEGAITGKIVFDKNGFHSEMPKAGIFKNVAVLDFSSMYPSIFRTFNISLDTIADNGEILVGDIKFNLKPEGLIPALLNELLMKRRHYEKIRDSFERSSKEWYIYSNYQAGIKQIANSLYGLNGYTYFRFYDNRIASSITYLARELIAFSWKKCEEAGYEALYCDTDSIFLKLDDNISKDECIFKINEISLMLNNSFYSFCLKFGKIEKHYFNIECEKIFEKLIFTGVKKKYVGRLFYKKGEFTNEIFGRGIELIKRDTPPLFKVFLKNIITKMIDDDFNLRAYINEFKNDIENHNFKEFAISLQISKHLEDYTKTMPQHIRGAIFSNKNLGFNLMKSDIIKLYFVKHHFTDVIALTDEENELPEGFKLDYHKYIERFIIKKLEMFNFLDELKEQKTLLAY